MYVRQPEISRTTDISCAPTRRLGQTGCMGWTRPPIRPRVVLHYSEDPDIEVFRPHVPDTNPRQSPAVWAIEPDAAPLYWFPRDCPRVTVWANDPDQQRVLADRFDTRVTRVHFARSPDRTWIRSTTLYEYELDVDHFEPWPDAEGQWISRATVRPISQRRMGNLVEEHTERSIDLRFVEDLGAARAEVLASRLPFSIVRFAPPRA